MTLYTHTPEQHAQLKAIRERLKELGDTKTAAMLDWVEGAECEAKAATLLAVLKNARYLLTNAKLPNGMLVVGGRLKYPHSVRDELIGEVDALLPQPPES